MERHPFLTVVAAEAAALVLCAVAWNAWTYRAAIRNFINPRRTP